MGVSTGDAATRPGSVSQEAPNRHRRRYRPKIIKGMVVCSRRAAVTATAGMVIGHWR